MNTFEFKSNLLHIVFSFHRTNSSRFLQGQSSTFTARPPQRVPNTNPPPSTSHKSSNQNGCSICASSEFACCSRIVCGRHWHTSWIMNCLLAACEAAHTGCRAQKEGKFTARDGDKAGKRILSGAEKSEETLNLSPVQCWGFNLTTKKHRVAKLRRKDEPNGVRLSSD